MLRSFCGSLENEITDAVGRNGLLLAQQKCGRDFSLTDLKRILADMPDGSERTTLENIVGIVEASHRRAIGHEGTV
ncbi:MAG: hypothetical protein PHO92_01790 [Candidatus Peribacteraceae bacterium]|nr:hypothetical protein [Candidatus Peribacteraceae bacterium]